MSDAPITIEDFEAADSRPPEYSDEALALVFTKRHGSNLRYVEAWKTWLFWDGNRWRRDATLYVFDLARILCREISASASPPKVAVAIASAKTVSAVERLARADRKHAAVVNQWDAVSLGARHARWRAGSPHRLAACLETRRLYLEDDDRGTERRLRPVATRRRADHRLPAVHGVPRAGDQQQRAAAALSAANGRLRPHRKHRRARAIFSLRQGCERQVGVHHHSCLHLG